MLQPKLAHVGYCAVACEYFAGSAFFLVDSFGDGWVHAGEAGVFAPDGSMQRHWLAGRGRRAIGLRHTLGASSAAWRLPEERRSA